MTKPKNAAATATQATGTPSTPKATKPKAAAKTAPATKPQAATAQYLKVQGTAKEIMEKGVWLNGKPVDSVALSVLAKFGTIKEVGKEVRPVGSMGRAGTIYELQGKSGFKLEIKGTPTKAPVKPQEPQKTEAATQSPATPLEALQTAAAAPNDGLTIIVSPQSAARLPTGFSHANAMGL